MPPLPPSHSDLLAIACVHVRDLLAHAIEHTASRPALIVSDGNCELACILSEAYRHCLPDALRLDFDTVPAAHILEAFAALPPGEFRIRVELFKRGLKVIEHPHLARMQAAEYAAYVDALAYDPAYYRVLGAELKRRI